MDVIHQWFQASDADRDGLVSGGEAAAVLSRFGVGKDVLKKIWDKSDWLGRGFLSEQVDI